MSIAYSNLLATVAVICLPVVGGIWIAPASVRRCFFALNLWGIPFLVGQYAQEGEWGSKWVQYHLLDLSYGPWGTALVICMLSLLWRGRLSAKVLFTGGCSATIAFGYASEIWDTIWAWRGGQTFLLAIDTGDYITITAGGLATILIYLWSD